VYSHLNQEEVNTAQINAVTEKKPFANVTMRLLAHDGIHVTDGADLLW
jgi:hypothetical protein